jgi:hypothetical protein
MSRSSLRRDIDTDGYDSGNSIDSDDSVDDETYKYKPLEADDEQKDHTGQTALEEVPNMYVWEGEEGDADLYLVKTSNDGNKNHKEPKEPP